MRAFLLGAGASHAYVDSPSGVRPPLARGFFEAYCALPLSQDLHVLVGFTVNYVRDTRSLDPVNFCSWNENIEDFLSEIDSQLSDASRLESMDFGDLVTYSRAYDEMIFLFSSVLNEIQNGPVSPQYSAFVSLLEPTDSLITFNWDTMLDRALYESGRWTPDSGYLLDFEALYENGWRKPSTILANATYELLKLHGSTNWLMPYWSVHFGYRKRAFGNPMVDPHNPPIFCFVRSDRTYPTFKDRSRPGYQPFSYYYYPPDLPISGGPPPDRTWISVSVNLLSDEFVKVSEGGFPSAAMPAIVAPVRYKQYGIIGGALDKIWAEAESRVSVCDELVLIGYSFPPTDTRAWELLERACSRRDSRLRVTVVNPHADELVTRLIDGLGDQIDAAAVNGTVRSTTSWQTQGRER